MSFTDVAVWSCGLMVFAVANDSAARTAHVSLSGRLLVVIRLIFTLQPSQITPLSRPGLCVCCQFLGRGLGGELLFVGLAFCVQRQWMLPKNVPKALSRLPSRQSACCSAWTS